MHHKTFIKRNAQIEQWQAEGKTSVAMAMYQIVTDHTEKHGVEVRQPRTEQPQDRRHDTN